MRALVAALAAEFRRYKALAEKAMAQLDEGQLHEGGAGGTNSVATTARHIAGNLKSRFTEFLTSDGEKPWRQREGEFEASRVSRAELLARWEEGFWALLDTLAALTDEQLDRTVTIRNLPLKVHEALFRSLAHLGYHVGQIVQSARSLRGDGWEFLSIPPGKSDEYNRNPTREKGPSA
ncbi:MAG: DUF1572 family protein [Planctomycetaceae bacterium]